MTFSSLLDTLLFDISMDSELLGRDERQKLKSTRKKADMNSQYSNFKKGEQK
jgi:hypothetical protein